MKQTGLAGAPLNDGILVSIILSESTTSLLDLSIPNIEETSETDGSTCIIRPISPSGIACKSRGWFSFLFSKREDPRRDGDGILSEVAFFSDSYRSDSDDSMDPDEEELDGFSVDEYKLDAVKVYTRPLVTAKSTAHEDKIYIEDNKIYVSILNYELCIVDSDLICRICHGGESLGDLLSPCRCRGTIALTHIECLEHWLRESSNSYCELCKHHFQIVRQPRYSVPWSVFMYLTRPGENLKDLLLDLLAFIVYTPSALVSTYMLMMICENIAKSQLQSTRNLSAHIVAFSAVFGMAAIDFTYSSWLIVTFQRQMNAWKSWYRTNSFLKLVLPEWKKRPYKHKKAVKDPSLKEDFE